MAPLINIDKIHMFINICIFWVLWVEKGPQPIVSYLHQEMDATLLTVSACVRAFHFHWLIETHHPQEFTGVFTGDRTFIRRSL